jgi:diguanylate cyclase (GGDEF)-like protein/PAS domain S-box-containing protein
VEDPRSNLRQARAARHADPLERFLTGGGTLADAHRQTTQPAATRPGLAEAAPLWQSLLEGMHDGFFFAHDPEGTLRYLSPAAEAILGCPEHALLDRPFEELLESTVAQEEARGGFAEIDGDCVLRRALRSDGSVVELAIRSYPVRSADGRDWIGGYARDVTRQLELQRQLSHDATHDPLTGLANRALLEARLRQVVARREREFGLRFAVLMLDLDGFKAVNDAFGHPAGDRLLRGVADRLARSVRPGDTVCRSGGDEFLILLEDVERLEDVLGVAERILDRLTLPFDLDGETVETSVSIGIVESEMSGGAPEEIIRHADAAMYRAKRLGRNRHALFLPAG